MKSMLDAATEHCMRAECGTPVTCTDAGACLAERASNISHVRAARDLNNISLDSRPVLVGECNPYDPAGWRDHMALFPDPPGCAGWRLCHRVLGLTEDEYLERYHRVNLCRGKWAAHAARGAAHAARKAHPRSVLVLLGARVFAAFADWIDGTFAERVFSVVTVAESAMGDPPEQRAVVLPHPSGRCLSWNQPGAYERARDVLRRAGAL